MDLGMDVPLTASYISPYLVPLTVQDNQVVVSVSARHIHLTEEHLAELFGHGYQLTPLKDLSQPGQYAAKETLKVIGPKGMLEEVRILGPTRPQSQVELARTDAYQLGVQPPVRDSGDTKKTPGIVLVGPKGALNLDRGVILAAAHIHMPPEDAERLDLTDGDRVQVLLEGERSIIYNNVLVRVHPQFALEMHVDTDEGNAALLSSQNVGFVLAKKLLM